MFTFKNIFSSLLLLFVYSSVLMAQPQISITLDNANVLAVSCANGIPCDGSITALASGGNPPGNYTFQWSSGETFVDVSSSTAIALCQGSQFVTVTDDNGGQAVASFEIGAPVPLAFDISSILVSEPSCFGDSDGEATIGATGGTPGYSYQWDDPAATTGPTLSGIPAGNYAVTTTDANGCSTSFTVNINQPDPLVIVIDSIDNGGYLSIHTTGGTFGDIDYLWSPDVSNDSIATNLPSGDYSITATDVNGCFTVLTVTTIPTQEINNNDYTFKLFPNPVEHSFNIETDIPFEQIRQIAIYNNLGKAVHLNTMSNISNQKIDVRFLPKGIYYVKMELVGGAFISRKLFVK